jgi:hypothetical protein
MSIFKIEIKAGNPAQFDRSPLTVYVNDSVYWYNSDPTNAHWPAPSAADKTGSSHIRFRLTPRPVRFHLPRCKRFPTCV